MATTNSAASFVAVLPELWAIVGKHCGVVGAFRLMLVCRAARQGVKEWLRTLPRLMVCGGSGLSLGWTVHYLGEVWQLDLAELQWERMPDLTCRRAHHACCAVRGGVVVLGGKISEYEDDDYCNDISASVEMLQRKSFDNEGNTFKLLPDLSCDLMNGPIAVAIDESESDQGQVLLIGGNDIEQTPPLAVVHKVDLASGSCTVQPPFYSSLGHVVDVQAAARLTDGRIVCLSSACSDMDDSEAVEYSLTQVLEPPLCGPQLTQVQEASWQWRTLPALSLFRHCPGMCVLSDGRVAVIGGNDGNGFVYASSEALSLDAGEERWDPLPAMHEARCGFACAEIGGCVIVAGGNSSTIAEVYEQGLGRWYRLPCSIPFDGQICGMGSALM
jgi:hypothetical protein